jgi:hypothetical protein
MLRPGTRDALRAHLGPGWHLVEGDGPAPDAPLTLEYEPLDPNDPLAYGRTIRRLWDECLERGQDFCLIEQDIEIGPSTLYDFRACSHPYCGAPYPWLTNVGVAMGCTRWRSAFIAAHADAVDEALAIGPHYRQFDVVFQRRVLAERYGAQPHVHAPVVHLNAARALRPDASPVPLEGVPVGDIGELL